MSVSPTPVDPPSPQDAAIAQAQHHYQAGLLAFERGAYRESAEAWMQAIALINRNSALGGDIQLWLVNAYAAMDQMAAAIALCRQLGQHPHYETRQQSKRLLYILEAPRLKLRPEWMTQIPDLAAIAAGEQQDQLASTRYPAPAKTPRRSPPPPPEPEPLDLTQVNTQDNQFIALTLGIALVILGGLLWLG